MTDPTIPPTAPDSPPLVGVYGHLGEIGRHDRRLVWSSVIVCGFLLLVVVVAGLWSRDVTSTSSATQRGQEIAACRTEFYAGVTAASSTLSIASAELQVLNTNGLVATADDDPAALAAAVASASSAVAEVTAAADDLTAQTARYVEATGLAADDPEAFLTRCRGGSPE